MSIRAMPFDGETYTADFERSFTRQEISSGIYPQNTLDPNSLGDALDASFYVEKTGDNVISIAPGAAMLDGLRIVSDSAITMTIPKTSLYYDIVLEADFSNSYVGIKYQGRDYGSAAENIKRSNLLYQICIATLNMSGTSGNHIIDSITDTRLDVTLCSDGKPLCGLVSAIYQVDTSIIAKIFGEGIPDGSVGISKLSSDIGRVLGNVGGTEPLKNDESVNGWFIGDINQRNGIAIDFDKGEILLCEEHGEHTSTRALPIPKMDVSDPYGTETYPSVISIEEITSGIKLNIDVKAGKLIVFDTKEENAIRAYGFVDLSDDSISQTLKDNAYVIVSQPEVSADGALETQSVKRIPLDKFISAMSDSLNLVKGMEEVENGIKITFNDGQEVCIPNGCGGLVFDENTKELSLLDSKGEVLGDTVPIIAGIDGLNMEIETDTDDESKKYLVLLDSGMNELARTQLPAMGGGTVSGTQMRLRNALPSTSFTVPYNETDGCSCELKFTFTSVDSDGYGTGSGSATYLVGGAEKLKQQNLPQGENSIDIGPYLTSGKTNTVKVIVEDAEGNKKTLTYNITVSHNYISSTFPLISKQNGNFTVPFTAVGSGTKTVHFLIDGEEIGTEENPPSSRERYKEIEALSHGSHTLEIYMTTILEGYTDEIRSNTLKFGIVAIEEGNTQPVFLMMSSSSEVLQYSNIETQFLLHDPLKGKCDVVCSVDGEPVTTLSVNDDVNVWNYRIMTAGEHTLSMAYDRGTEDVSDDISVSTMVNATIVDVAKAETAGLKFHFNAANRSNNEPNPAFYEYTNSDGETYSLKFNNMNFINDGWTGKSLNIGVGSSVEINCSPFADDVTSTTGKTLEFYFKAKNVYNYNSLVISCFANSKGIQITPNSGSLALNSENALDIQYKDEKDIKISFVVSRRNSENEGQMQLVYIYVNSCIAGVLKYSTADSFSQIDKPCITIGSNEAGIELYNVRYYDVDLSSYQILDNFIADTPDPLEMLERNKRNDIFDQNNQVDPDKLHEDCPYLIVSCPRLPDYKGDVIKGVSGRFVDKLHPERSFTFKDAEMDVQGTSSAGYKVKNFKIKYKGGFIIIGINGEDNTVVGYSIFGEDVDVPVSVFCYKADVASSEGANNVVLVKIWEEMVPYKTPPQQAEYDEKGYNTIRQTINGRAIVLFWENSDTGAVSFRGKYNFNNDKSTAETFGFVDDADHNCQCWEFKDNGLELTEFRGDDFDSLNANGKPVWTDAFEARFPDKLEDTTKLRRVVSWVASTDTTKATGNTLSRTYTDIDGKAHTKDTAEYRLAKFKTEFEDYFVKIPVLFYYWFTGLFLMVDSRAKNQFITTWDGIHWLFLPYDADTALGTNNMGALKFGYWLEDTDQVNGADVYNGQISVLWKNVSAVFSEDISNIAQEAVSAGLTYEYVRDMFNKHQKPWSEAIFCADTVVKYIDPYIETGSEDYLDKAQGNKEVQRDNWLFNRFNFFNSKHHTGSARENFITLRMAEPHGDTVDYVGLDMNLHITPYTHLYAGVNYGQALQLERAYPGEEVTFVSPLDRPSDSPVYIYSADQLKDIGDLSPLYPTHVDVGAAVNLEKLIVGNPTIGYRNEGLISLGIKNNSKLKIVDIRNCVNLTGSITAGECENIEEIYADNTRITSVTLPVGGKLKTMRLPNTIENITVRKHKLIQELYIGGYGNIKTLYVDECPTIDVMDILQKAQNLTHVRLTDVEWNLPDTSLLDRLLALGGVPENAAGTVSQSYLSGSVHVPQINTAQLNAYKQAWKDLDITYDMFIPQYRVTFVNDDNTVLNVQYVNQGGKAVDPITMPEGAITTPTKASSRDTVYTFAGWDKNLDMPVLGDTTIKATYTGSVRQYTVRYIVENQPVQTSTVDVYGSAPYEGETPRKAGSEALYTWYLFSGWSAQAVNVTSDMDIVAQFDTCILPAVKTQDELYLCSDNPNSTSTYTIQELYAICMSDRYKDYLAIGDRIEIYTADIDDTIMVDSSIVLQVYDFNHYRLSEDKSKFAHVVFGMVGIMNAGHRMNATNTNVGGWAATEMRQYLNETIYPALPARWQALIMTVDVLSSEGNTSATITASENKLFLPSQVEVIGVLANMTNTVPYSDEVDADAENITFPIFTDRNSIIKYYYNGTGSPRDYWMRSPEPTNAKNYRYISANGGWNTYIPQFLYAVSFVCCIGG